MCLLAEGKCYVVTAQFARHKSSYQPRMNLPIVHSVADGLIVQRRTLGVVVDPVEDLLVPEQAILLLEHPVVLIREVEEARGHTNVLQDVEQGDTVTFGQTVVEGVVDDKLRG
jgi:hypothetical protein